MILDSLQQFSSGQDLSQVTGDYPSTNEIPYGISNGIPSAANGGGPRDMGIGDDPALKLLVQVIEPFTSGGAATMQVIVEGAPDNGSGAPGAYAEWFASPVYTLATLAQAGQRLLDIDFPRPPAGIAPPAFVHLLYRIAGATTTAGTVDAYVVIDRDDQIRSTSGVISGYPAGINVAN